MKNTFKKLSVFAAAILLGLVGCGKTNEPTTSLDPSTSHPTTSLPSSTTTSTPTPSTSTPAPSTSTPDPEPTTSEPTPTTPTPDNIDIDIRLEAENGSLGATNLSIKENTLASNGQYMGGLNDCGQGLFFIQYVPVAGEHDVEIAYFTEQPGSKHELLVNGVATEVVYDENTGLGETITKVATKTVKANFKQGYNTISLSKKGQQWDDPVYGGYAEVDYIEIKGTQQTFDKDALSYDLDEIKIEAELGKINSSALPVPIDGNASNGYVVGEINAAGNGAEFHFNFPATGKYELKIAYGKDGGARPVDITLDIQVYTYALEDYDGQAWNNFHLSNVAATFDLTKGEHVLKVARGENSNWFCFDYIVLTKVVE